MIEVEHLSKTYGSTAAIADVSFSVETGEILGFLGPNGAGKTTTMRILSGYLQHQVAPPVLLASTFTKTRWLSDSASAICPKTRRCILK